MSAQSSTLQPTCRASAAAEAVEMAPAKAGLAAALWDTLYLWSTRAHQRARLAELDDRMLKDIGLGRSEAYREAAKPFWLA